MDYWPVEMGGGGRTKHDDWALPFLRGISRLSTAYAVHLPFRRIAGNQPYKLIPVMNDEYPIVPGTPITMKVAWDNFKKVERPMRHVWSMTCLGEPGEWSRQEAFIGGEWVECFWCRTIKLWGGKVLELYGGLKLDIDSPMAWYPEVSGSVGRP